jgi:hypothetical protein
MPADTLEIVKEGSEHFQKIKVDIDLLVQQQDEIIASLLEQLARAEQTKLELLGKK